MARQISFATHVIEGWREHYEKNVTQHSLAAICRTLARQYHCHPNTVRYHLDAGYAERHRRHCSKSRRRRNLQRREQAGIFYRREGQSKDQEYCRAYNRYLYHLNSNTKDFLLRFVNTSPTSLEEIARSIMDASEGVLFGRKILIRNLARYELDQRQQESPVPPFLVRVGPETWIYSHLPSPNHLPIYQKGR